MVLPLGTTGWDDGATADGKDAGARKTQPGVEAGRSRRPLEANKLGVSTVENGPREALDEEAQPVVLTTLDSPAGHAERTARPEGWALAAGDVPAMEIGSAWPVLAQTGS